MIRVALATEKPDILFIFTDPRFFIWLFEMEDEIHQVCPVTWWHVWDNYPSPQFNKVLYESTDAINCHSYLSYQICSEMFPNKTQFIPHALPKHVYHQLPKDEIKSHKSSILGRDRADHFVVFWMGRNAKRKRPGDLLWSWKLFLDKLEKKHGHRKATLLMHTEPTDPEGPNLYSNVENLGIMDNVVFSRERVDFSQINVLHNIADAYIMISFAEGFGLPSLEAMQTGTPIIAVKTGGLTRQVVDHRDGSHNGIALDVELQTMVGSQQVPYIYEDYVSVETISDAILEMHEYGPEKREKLGQKARQYALSEFSYDKTIDLWHESMKDTVENWESRYDRWSVREI